MRWPNFFIVGAPRSGTTSMVTALKQHPEIWVSLTKEPHFFGSDLTAQPGSIREEDLYLALFAGAGDLPRAGEGSVWYLSSPRAPFEIRDATAGAKIIIMLREPAQMACSLYSLYRRTGNEDLPTFEEALAAEPERRAGRRIPGKAYFPEGLLYTDAARYADKVQRYFDVFGRENVLCLLFDDFVRDTAAVYRQTLQFLGVDPDFQAELDPDRANLQLRMLVLRQMRQLPPELIRRIQFGAMKLHDAAEPRAPLAPETAEGFRARAAADVARLGALLDRNLDAWTRGEAVAPVPPPRQAPGGDRLAALRALKSFPPELRARHDKVETLERKVARWQRMRVPELSLEQRPYSPAWATWFAEERARIAAELGPRAPRIEHFGSTSVPGLSSKDIVDIAVGLDGPPGPEDEAAFARLGYTSYGNSPVDPETLWFWKLSAGRAHVLHVCDARRSWIGEQEDMREYLRAHPEERDRYAARKRSLAEEKDQGLLSYSLRKLAITVELVDRAQAWRAGRERVTAPPAPAATDPPSSPSPPAPSNP